MIGGGASGLFFAAGESLNITIHPTVGHHHTILGLVGDTSVVDIDLLLYEGYTEETEELTVPHPRMMERAFVLVPLAELFPKGEALGVPFENVFSPDVRRIGEL